MIKYNQDGEIICGYDCIYSEKGICYGGVYECPHNIELARVCLPDAIEMYEYLKSQEPYGDEYYSDLSWHKNWVDNLNRIIRSL